MRWLLLVYTLPAEPTRMRASVWRELKKLGASYLRDGVCILPDQPTTSHAMQAVVHRVRAFDGHATLVEADRLDDLTAHEVVREGRAAREVEYAAVADSSRQLVTHVRRELRHRDFRESELQSIRNDLKKLRRWLEQIRARDYFGCAAADDADDAVTECESAMQALEEGALVT